MIDAFLDEKHPENYNFLLAYIENDDTHDFLSNHPIYNILKYKNGQLSGLGPYNVTRSKGANADCDKEAFFLYKELNWQNSIEDSNNGDTMNSFWNIYSRFMNIKYADDIEKKGELNCRKSNWPTIASIPYILKNFSSFDEVHNNKELLNFANNVYTIGNFIVWPHIINSGRSLSTNDYFDLTLHMMYEFLEPIDAWDNFIEKYFLEDYIDKNNIPIYFWKGHNNNIKPLEEKDIIRFLKRVNLRICRRGILIVKNLRETRKKPS
ncbi:hypothetical protein [Macrococcoides caseolyticum]|uniref:hypothetical protein n=1 Tax=Macrococcoides caseolyticum TaxID=69966 RepID=UPI000C34098B|nr:hypothetical protein [Macrococcus caseolyticus]PKE15989.1 hypothetical protein CW718_12040 [Macrococcus caseolyticus]PKE66779.1 hypothetical protein CW663_11490 [Macrococcus caseolyticus]